MSDADLAKITDSDLARVGAFIRERKERLIAEWEQISREENPEAREEVRSQLRNNLPDFLTAYAERLESGDREVPRDLAARHGAHRWETGWDVVSLSRDFMILRNVIIQALFRELKLPPKDLTTVASGLDLAVSISIERYVHHSERELAEQNELLSRKNYELKRFAHMVSHEVRHPLSSMVLAIESLRRRFGDQPEAKAHFQSISEARSDLVEVLDSLLGFADLELNGERRDEQVDLNIACEEAIHKIHHLVEVSEASITREELPIVHGDAVALRSVFMNLIENAIKYAGEGAPRVTIRAAEENGDWWDIRFSDHGVGIAEKDKARIFRFMQRASSDPEIMGTGIGLAFCKRVVEQHGGTLTVESTLGEGSTFHLRLPRR